MDVVVHWSQSSELFNAVHVWTVPISVQACHACIIAYKRLQFQDQIPWQLIEGVNGPGVYWVVRKPIEPRRCGYCRCRFASVLWAGSGYFSLIATWKDVVLHASHAWPWERVPSLWLVLSGCTCLRVWWCHPLPWALIRRSSKARALLISSGSSIVGIAAKLSDLWDYCHRNALVRVYIQMAVTLNNRYLLIVTMAVSDCNFMSIVFLHLLIHVLF